MTRGPYRTFTWKALPFLIGLLIAGALWLLVGVPEDIPGLAVLSLVSGVFGAGGLILFCYVLKQRYDISRDIRAQDASLAVLYRTSYPGLQLWSSQMIKCRVLSCIHGKLYRKDITVLPLDEVPFLMAYVQDGPVLWEWKGIKKYAKGVAQGTKCTIELQGTLEETTKLLTHELGHLVLDYCTKIPAHEHHKVMIECEIEGLGFAELTGSPLKQ